MFAVCLTALSVAESVASHVTEYRRGAVFQTLFQNLVLTRGRGLYLGNPECEARVFLSPPRLSEGCDAF
jgi:hypothetical protein